MDKRRDIFRRVKEHRKVHTECKIKLKGATAVIEHALRDCENETELGRGIRSNYSRWLQKKHFHLVNLVSKEIPEVEVIEDLRETRDVILANITRKLENYTLTEEEGDNYFTFLYPFTKYFFQTVSYREELHKRYKLVFPLYEDLGEGPDGIESLPLGIWRFTLREMMMLETRGVRDVDIVSILGRDLEDIYEDIIRSPDGLWAFQW